EAESPAQAAGRAPRAPFEMRYGLARQVFGPLLGESALEQSGGLADFDQVAVGVAHVAADLSPPIDRGRHELGPFRAPLLIALLDVGDPQVQEAGDGVPGLVVDDRDV